MIALFRHPSVSPLVVASLLGFSVALLVGGVYLLFA